MTKWYMNHREYLESGVWKCKESPSGAHHWIEHLIDGRSLGIFYCKWCGDVKEFPVTFASASGSFMPDISLKRNRLNMPREIGADVLTKRMRNRKF